MVGQRRSILTLQNIASSLVALFVGLLQVACAPKAEKGPDTPRSFVLISLDTFRHDALSLGTGALPRAPNLTELAAASVVFSTAYSPMCFTLPAHAAMLTGFHPAALGVTNEKTSLPLSVPTVAELLSENGFASSGVVSNDFLDPRFGLARGFDRWEVVPHERDYADRVVQRGMSELDRLSEGESPFLLFLHFNDAHSDFVGQGTELPYFSRRGEQVLAELEVAGSVFCPDPQLCATELLLAVERGDQELAPSELRALEALYWAGVEDLDESLGPLLSRVQRGVADGWLTVIVTADHGEEFLEHGHLLHSQVYDECLRVPLLIATPGAAHTQVDTLVELGDIATTILSLAGFSTPSLLDFTDSPPARGGLVLQDKRTWERDRWALRTGEWKLVADLDRGQRELYRLPTDAGETTNLWGLEPAVDRRLEVALERGVAQLRSAANALAATAPTAAPDLSAEEVLRLRALGYLR